MPQAERVRRKIADKFVELGTSADAPIQETILIRDGFYCGRKLRCGGLHAVWFVEEAEVKFYDPAGSLLCVFDVSDPTELRKAS